jgi:hypothetical protein
MYGYGPGRFLALIFFVAWIFFIVAWNSLTALERESYNDENRRENWYSLLVGIGVCVLFIWLGYEFMQVLHNK